MEALGTSVLLLEANQGTQKIESEGQNELLVQSPRFHFREEQDELVDAAGYAP